MKQIKVNGKQYTLKYTFRAARYNKCADSVMGIMINVSDAEERGDTKALISEITDLPAKVTEMFYAGLLQMHGTHPKGDGTVADYETAEELLDEFLEEQHDKEGGISSYYEVMALILDCMRDDGFFDLIGLSGMMEAGQETAKKPRKRASAKA